MRHANAGQMPSLALIPVLIAALFQAQAQAADAPFTLGTVTVVGKKADAETIGEDQVASLITRDDMVKYNRDNVGDAVNLLSGVNISTNVRNEKTVYLRGYDSRQAPLFIDGLPVYVPYDGYVDFARFTTADLAAIQVAKGFSSIVYGPNTLGGAINLVSRKPTKAFEGDAKIGFGSGNMRQGDVNLGSRQGMWYFQAGASYIDANNFPLSSSFSSTANQPGGDRKNSYYTDDKLSFKAGFTPNVTDEYVFSYYKQDGKKGQPPSIYPASAKYWRWPYWNKESVALSTRTSLGATETVKVKWYVDKYANALDIYSNATYSVLPVSGISDYDDRTHGASVELDSTRFANQEIKLIYQSKVDTHISKDGNKVVTENFRDTLTYIGAEDNIQLAPAWLLSLGVSQSQLKPENVFTTLTNNFGLPGSKSKTGYQAGLFYDYTADTRFYATVADKSRLPTLKDRYSGRFNTYVANLGLKPEEAVNYEVGYQGAPWKDAKAEAALFYNDIKDKIMSVYASNGLAAGTCTTTNKCRMDNVGKVEVSGIELGLSTPLAGWLDGGVNYTVMTVKNVSNPTIKITDIPNTKLTLNLTARPAAKTEVIAFVESEGYRWSSNTVQVSSYTTLNLKAVYHPLLQVTTEVGVSNLTDRNYSLSDGFPSPGRMWFANADYRF